MTDPSETTADPAQAIDAQSSYGDVEVCPRAQALSEAIAIGIRILADMDSAARVAPPESRGQDAAAYYSVRAYVSDLERLAKNNPQNAHILID